ncbi:hypothetical protein ACFL6S_29030 [Candidatus Poribacteria bacterium]
MVSKAIASRIGKLAEIAQELREGERFEIRRLTITKALCEESQAAVDFAIYIARLVCFPAVKLDHKRRQSIRRES